MTALVKITQGQITALARMRGGMSAAEAAKYAGIPEAEAQAIWDHDVTMKAAVAAQEKNAGAR